MTDRTIGPLLSGSRKPQCQREDAQMTTLLAILLAVDAILHGVIIARFGVKGNEPPLVFGLAYAALTVAIFLGIPYALWAVLFVTLVGLVGLTVAYKNISHEKTVERVIWVLNVVIILFASFILFAR
ncbi:MAG: hypothetical protein C0524_06720 [Rhodobacter sp.]|nr:hypothetical protein [Rhodobacter sp.]